VRLLRLFISSTFRDMQKERDILARLVFPRQRAALAAQDAALQEVDLRWGVTDVMSRDGGALIVCLREIAQCHPLFLGMLGRRAGWSPPRSVLERFDGGFAATVPAQASMTEIEMRYAAHLAVGDPRRRFTVMVRSDRLSATIDRDEAEWTASEPLRDWALSWPSVQSIEYDSFEDFERRVDGELSRVLAAEASVVCPAPAMISLPQIPRSSDVDKFRRATAARRPTLVTAERGIGSSWLARRWVSEDPHGLYIDGRVLGGAALLQALRAPAAAQGVNPMSNTRTVIGREGDADLLTSALLDRMSRQPAARRIAFDHYEDGVTDEARADIAWIPTALPRGCSLALITRSERLRTQAADMGWQMHPIERIRRDEAADFAEKYLQLFAKYLTPEQKSLLTSAPWSTNLSSLILALDELRRHGAFETVDKRLRELAGRDSGAAMAEELISGLTSVMPAEWNDAVKDALLAIRVSVRGLEEWEIRAAAGAAARGSAGDTAPGALPSHLWSAIRISLGSSLVARNALLDIAGGPLLSWVDGCFAPANDRVQRVSAGLSAALRQGPAIRRWTEAPRLAELRDPAHGLETLLSDPLTVQELIKVGVTFAEGWLSRLAPQAQQPVIAGWPARLFASATPVGGVPISETAYQLGVMAARAGANGAALQLLEPDGLQAPSATRAHGDEKTSLVAFLRRDRNYFLQLAQQLAGENWPAPADAARVNMGLTVLAACADRIAELDAGTEQTLIARLASCLSRDRDPQLEGQLQIYAGQLLLIREQWSAAASRFAAAGRVARRLGHARLLCQSLERLAAVQLERNKFRSARQAASECRQLAFRARLTTFEALAFERQIEVERRRADWTAAYDLAAAFLARSREGLCDVDRAKAALAAIERSDSDWHAARPHR
jgi:hypothetical protein